MAETILVIIILINLILFVYFAKVLYINIKSRIQINTKIKDLEKNKCKGPHAWINMSIEPGSKTHVCRTCYFSPKHDTFVKDFFVKEAVYAEQFEKDYKKYFDEKVQEISNSYNISVEEITEINEKVNKIKQDFSLEYLKKMIQDLDKSLEKKQ
jgi:hypothetical protein